jgi:hypothetical protein
MNVPPLVAGQAPQEKNRSAQSTWSDTEPLSPQTSTSGWQRVLKKKPRCDQQDRANESHDIDNKIRFRAINRIISNLMQRISACCDYDHVEVGDPATTSSQLWFEHGVTDSGSTSEIGAS